jgi:capsular polysaccharide biosynthesis protein
MSRPTPADPSALSPAETALLPELVAAVLAAEFPRLRLQQELDELAREQRAALAAALFESVVYRIDVRDYWLYHRVWRIYEALGPTREDAAYLAAAMAVQLGPEWSGSGQAFSGMFRILLRRGRPQDALDLFNYQMEYMPEQPAAEPDEVARVLAQTGATVPRRQRRASAPDERRDHRAIAAEVAPAWSFPTPGGRMPYCLADLAKPVKRARIDVAELTDAEVLICNGAVIVLDRHGNLHDDLTVCSFPDQVRRKFERLERNDTYITVRHADEAMLISDRFPPPNLCHMLLDQITRLAVYRKLGVEPSRALVVGPESRMAFQQSILRRAGVTDLLGTDRIARLRAKRLWVSSNCRDLQHAAHQGAAWAVEYVREILGGRGGKGWRRLYISRGDVPGRRVVNEAELIALLEPHGFDVIMPGRMPYEAQLAAFRQASHVIAPHGAALAHMVLCPEGAQIMEIFHPLYGTAAYAMQAPASGVNYAAMVARDAQSDAPEWNDPTVADVSTSRFLDRHLRVDLDTVAGYLATVL